MGPGKGPSLASNGLMRIQRSTLATVGAATAAAVIFKNERNGRQAAERFAAAALETLLNAIDANDAETGAHVRRVATYALILADAAGLDEHDVRVVEQVALFHDIGKIHEALFDIIHDHRTLTPAERRAVLTHPQRGADVLAPLEAFYPELPDGVLSHHERWNGAGYPRQLKGRRIPISARIVAIADTFDAITHSRRYRAERSAEMARDIILAGRGTEFDPLLVDMFILPPVFAKIVAAERRVERWKVPVKQRRTGEKEDRVPDITFRWRPGRSGGRGQPATDRPRRTAR
ncbi:MAG: metal-dependent phosphohydrolase region [Gemmatimonadetes bacterium]|jgi:putative nucleotidyltransferase with HDIG domain|nr:metal-dependent phosphohydrolase region [Gemmatimonadota bacterium]